MKTKEELILELDKISDELLAQGIPHCFKLRTSKRNAPVATFTSIGARSLDLIYSDILYDVKELRKEIEEETKNNSEPVLLDMLRFFSGIDNLLAAFEATYSADEENEK